MQNERFDAIPIPRELGSVVKAGIQEGIREQKRLNKNKRMLRYGTTAAATLAVVCAGVLLVSEPSLAARLPFIGRAIMRKSLWRKIYREQAKGYRMEK